MKLVGEQGEGLSWGRGQEGPRATAAPRGVLGGARGDPALGSRGLTCARAGGARGSWEAGPDTAQLARSRVAAERGDSPAPRAFVMQPGAR